MNHAAYSTIDDALEILSAHGPDLRNGMTSHAPMAVEALCAMGRPDAVRPWLAEYRKGMLPRPRAQQPITADTWRQFLARSDRTTDWSDFFEEQLQQAPWRDVLRLWTGHLAPGICASAAHGVIRVGHAARSLAEQESPWRKRELAEALGYWAACYQELPSSLNAAPGVLRPRQAIASVPVVPAEQRVFLGTIVSSLEGLATFPPFASVIGLIDVRGDAQRLATEIAEVFARVYLANAHDILTAIVFIHGVTSVASLLSLLPYLDEPTAGTALRYAWQASCGLYSTFGTRPAPIDAIEAPSEDAQTLIDMAIAHGDEHVIKFTEACLRLDALDPSPAYRAAARSALELLPRA